MRFDPLCPPRFFTGVPGCFRASCREAALGTARDGYSRPGYLMGSQLTGLVPYAFEEDEWQAELTQFGEILDLEDDGAALRWLVEFFPRMMAIVPKRRRCTFMTGLRRAIEDCGLEV